MRKLLFMALCLGGFSLQAQSFDFSCGTTVDLGIDAPSTPHNVQLAGDSAVIDTIIGYELCETTDDNEVVNTQYLRNWTSSNSSSPFIGIVRNVIAYIEDNDLRLPCD